MPRMFVVSGICLTVKPQKKPHNRLISSRDFELIQERVENKGFWCRFSYVNENINIFIGAELLNKNNINYGEICCLETLDENNEKNIIELVSETEITLKLKYEILGKKKGVIVAPLR